MRSRTKALSGGLIALALVAGLAAQQPGVHPISGRRYAPVMGYQGALWLERGERDEEEAPDVALNALKIAKGVAKRTARCRGTAERTTSCRLGLR